MRKRVLLTSIVPALLFASIAVAQHPMPDQKGAAKSAMNKKSDAQKIAEAMGAAPDAISKGATIMDWPADDKGAPRQLRAGSNGWVCFPSSPGEFGGASQSDPMCLDKQWQAWGDAWQHKAQPKVSGTGIAYMLKGDKGASNTDPFATGPTADNQWVVAPPHIMVLYEDTKILDAFPTDPKSGGPWVMWKGTPYAHLMVPIAPKQMAGMPMMKK